MHPPVLCAAPASFRKGPPREILVAYSRRALSRRGVENISDLVRPPVVQISERRTLFRADGWPCQCSSIAPFLRALLSLACDGLGFKSHQVLHISLRTFSTCS